MPRLLIVTSAGPDNPTTASVPFHIAANGAGASQVECGIALAGDAVELMKPDVQAKVRGIGIPPLADLVKSATERGIQFFV
jgi:predicted peroxiredoxin